MSDNEQTESKTTVEETVVETPKADEGGPLGNVTEAVTTGEPEPEVVERKTVVEEKPAE